MEKTETKRKLRADLSEEERERAERIGSLEYASERNPFKTYGNFKFIPSKEQH